MATKDVLMQHFEAFNSHNLQNEPFAADSEMVTPAGTMKGRENVLGFLRVFQEAFPDLRLEVRQLLVDGSLASAEGTLLGTHNAVLHAPTGDIPATGKAVELRWGAIYEVRDSEMIYEHLYFDQMEMMGQLGLLPS